MSQNDLNHHVTQSTLFHHFGRRPAAENHSSQDATVAHHENVILTSKTTTTAAFYLRGASSVRHSEYAANGTGALMTTRLTDIFQVRKGVKVSPLRTPSRKTSLRDKLKNGGTVRRQPFKEIINIDYDNSPISRGRIPLKRRDVKTTTAAAAISSMTTRSQQLNLRLRRRSHSVSSNRHRSSTTPTSSVALMEEVERMIVEESEEARRMEMVCAVASPSMESLARRISLTHMHVETTAHHETSLSTGPSSPPLENYYSTKLHLDNSEYHSSPESFENYSLKIVPDPQIKHKAFQSIDGWTLAGLLERLTREQFLDRFILVDCRYPFEYEGGHIMYAINIYDKARIKTEFLDKKEPVRIPIFYCEFSQKRGPTMALALRDQDRRSNKNAYPHIHYKEVYLLDRGYRNFFSRTELQRYCVPQNYIEMRDPHYTEQLKRFDSHVKRKCHRQPLFSSPS